MYSVVVVLSNGGAQVPLMPFSEVTGKVIAGAPLQMADIAAKVGVIWLVITISMVVPTAHPPEGVKV